MQNDNSVARIALAISSRPGRPAEVNPIYRGAQIAMEEVKADDSLPVPLDWEVFDDSGDPAMTRKLAREIVDDPSIIAVVGSMGSGEAFINAPIFHEAGLLQISPCASHPKLCEQGYETFFRLVANEDVQGGELARMARGYLDADRAAIVHAGDLWGATVSDIFAREFEGLGGQVVEKQGYEASWDDFSELIGAVVDAEPDLVFLAVHPVEGPTISSGLRDAGLDVPFLGTDAMKPVFPLGGGEEGEEVYHTHSGADFRRLASAAAFREAYTARFPEDSTYSPETYDAFMIIAEALRRAGVADRERVLEEARKLSDFQGVTGLINFDSTGERIDAPISFYRVRKTEHGREMQYLGTTTELLQEREDSSHG
jgi:branched-chain amino acid transport system substrate-binding protein